MEAIQEVIGRQLVDSYNGSCVKCGESMVVRVYQLTGISRPILDNVCIACNSVEPLTPQRRRDIAEEWKQICPPQYLETNPKLIPEPLLTQFRGYAYGPIGMFVIGTSGTFKTRSMYLLMRRLFYSGRTVTVYDGVQFGQAVMDSFHDGAVPDYTGFLHNLEYTDCLFIDDIGQGKITERVEEAYFVIAERRMQQLKPTFYTSNLKGIDLEKLFSVSRGPAILRRLRESTVQHSTDMLLQGLAKR